jgi:hypothetical protein
MDTKEGNQPMLCRYVGLLQTHCSKVLVDLQFNVDMDV